MEAVKSHREGNDGMREMRGGKNGEMKDAENEGVVEAGRQKTGKEEERHTEKVVRVEEVDRGEGETLQGQP